MTTRASHILLVLAAFLTGLVIFLGVFLFATGNLGGGSGAPGASAIGGPFQLIDQDGKPITDADLKGRPFLVFFGYTHCPDVCPATLFEVSELMRALGKDADRAGALFVTVDPERDTPAALKDYLASFDPRVRAATGNRAAIDAAERAYRVYAKKVPSDKDKDDYSMDHTATVFLLDSQGNFQGTIAYQEDQATALQKLRNLLAKG